MAQNKTRPTKVTVASFLDSIEDDAKRGDAKKLAKLMRRVSGRQPVMWGPSIVGFGKYDYKYESGREGEAARIAFSPRAQNRVVYIPELAQAWPDRLAMIRRAASRPSARPRRSTMAPAPGQCIIAVPESSHDDRGRATRKFVEKRFRAVSFGCPRPSCNENRPGQADAVHRRRLAWASTYSLEHRKAR